jgi:hypothetical protein
MRSRFRNIYLREKHLNNILNQVSYLRNKTYNILLAVVKVCPSIMVLEPKHVRLIEISKVS